MDAATPVQIVTTSDEINCIVSYIPNPAYTEPPGCSGRWRYLCPDLPNPSKVIELELHLRHNHPQLFPKMILSIIRRENIHLSYVCCRSSKIEGEM